LSDVADGSTKIQDYMSPEHRLAVLEVDLVAVVRQAIEVLVKTEQSYGMCRVPTGELEKLDQIVKSMLDRVQEIENGQLIKSHVYGRPELTEARRLMDRFRTLEVEG
jgi:hypothetical protein